MLKVRRNFPLGLVSVEWKHEGIHVRCSIGFCFGNQEVFSASSNSHVMARL